MDSLKIPFQFAGLKKDLVALEYPEALENTESFEDKIQINKTTNGPKFVYKPLPEVSDRLQISSNTQKRNLILLKVKKNIESGEIEDASVISLIEKLHVFRDLFDYAGESEIEASLHNEIKSAAESFDELKIENISKIVSKSEVNWDTFCIPPYKFSHVNLPFSTRDIRTNVKSNQKDESFIQEKSWNISFDALDIPNNPSDDCIEKAKNVPRNHIEAVSKIFNERPIVSKLYLQHKIKDSAIVANLKQILPLLAYHWKNGPWHLLWTKYGIDPRKDNKFRFYQSIELRNKMFAKELRRGKSVVSGTVDVNAESPKLTNSFCFDGENLILNYLTYQYLDLTYLPLQQIVNYPGGIQTSASEKEGWYPIGTAKKLRDLMKIKWFELLKTMDLSSLPPNKLEEILEISAPTSSTSLIGADWNSINKFDKDKYSESEEEFELADEESDYEIFDY